MVGKPIVYRTKVQGMDDQLDALRDHIARVLSVRMAQAFKDEMPVPWTTNLRIVPAGIAFRRRGFLGARGEEEFVSFGQARIGVDQGQFILGVPGEPKPAIIEPVSQMNFFPWFLLLVSLCQSAPMEPPAPPA